MRLEDWNAVLLGDVRARGRAGQRLYLYVDRDLLAKLSGLQPAEAVTDFCKAVQASTGARPFKRAADAAIRWRMQGFRDDPSFVAHLAMTVLAVTEEPLGSTHGVYRRQNELLGLAAEATAPPEYGEDVPILWRVWNSWLDGPGSVYGRSSARTHPHWTLQGWARSQALIRHHDRLRIEQFLEDIGTTRADDASVSMFKLWLKYRGAAGHDLLKRLEDEAAEEIVQEVLEDEVSRWRREGPRARHGERTRGLLQYDDWTDMFSGAVEVDPTWHGIPVNTGQDEPYTPGPFDAFLLVTPDVSESQLLRNGVDHALTDRVVVRFGGEDVYVMRDEPRVSGRLQCRAVDVATNYHVFAHQARMSQLTRALGTAGLEVAPRWSNLEGWFWFDNLRLDRDNELLRLLGLAALVPTATERPTLEGGLQLTGSTYLVGGEPDLLLPDDSPAAVSLDNTPLGIEPGQRRINLADLCLDPGVHTVSSEQGHISFRTVDFLRETATSGGVARPVHFVGDGFRFDDPVRDPDASTVLAGATIVGGAVPEPLAIRRAPNAECLILTETGDLYEIWPSSPAWLRMIGLELSTVDVLHAVRTTTSPAAFLIVRNPRNRRKRGIAIPSSSSPIPGRSPSRPRPDLVGEIVAERWRWVGPADDDRARRVLSLAIRQRHDGQADRRPVVQTPTLRRDVYQGRLPDNPYDDVLTWLSEQENARVTATRFAETWAWLCRRYARNEIAGEWRRALTTLAMLGHVERDFARQQVAAAPAALVALPSASGLSVLAGARPARLHERTDDPDDPDDAVAAAASGWTLHYRTPTDFHGQPIGPSTMYIEWDSSERDRVRAGLHQLGVSMQGCIAKQLLWMHPSLQQSVRAGQKLLMSPGREPWLRSRTATATWEWSRRQTDSVPGFYRYRLAHGNMFAWREAPDMPLVTVEPAVGQWLSRAAQGETSLLSHHPVGNMLLVPVTVPLPGLLARALALRTGMPPYIATIHRQGRDADTDCLVYENVDANTAGHVARLLQQELQTEYGILRMN